MTLAGDVAGCFNQNEVDVCYRPFLALIDLPIYASPLGGPAIGLVPAGNNFCRQSVPQFGSNCTRNLALRAPEGFDGVWGYANSQGLSGWVWGPGLADNNGAGGCCGPAGADYRCGDDKAGVCPSAPCDGAVVSSFAVSGIRGIDQTAYLRYAQSSTPFYYLVPGCTVEQYRRSPSAGTYTCVRVVEGAGYAKNNIRGWVLTDALA